MPLYWQAFLFSVSRNATGFDQDDTADLHAESAFDYHLLEKLEAACVQTNNGEHAPSRSSHQRGPSIRPGSRYLAAQHLLKRTSLLSLREVTPAAPAGPGPSAAPRAGCARNLKTAPRHRDACRRTPLFRVNCADAVAVATLPHAFSDCASHGGHADTPRP